MDHLLLSWGEHGPLRSHDHEHHRYHLRRPKHHHHQSWCKFLNNFGRRSFEKWTYYYSGVQKSFLPSRMRTRGVSLEGYPADWQPAKKATGAFMAGCLFVIDWWKYTLFWQILSVSQCHSKIGPIGTGTVTSLYPQNFEDAHDDIHMYAWKCIWRLKCLKMYMKA